MVKAVLNGTIIAESSDTIIVENNYYFPKKDVKLNYMSPSDYHTTCPWKGKASYYDIEIDGKKYNNIAWYYPEPKKGAEMVKDRIAFWKEVKFEES